MADRGLFAVAGAKNGIEDGQRFRPVFGADGVGEFVQRALFGGQDHGLNVAERDLFSFADVQDQLFQFATDHGHIAAERVHQLAGGIGIDFDLLRGGAVYGPAHGIAFFHARQLDDPAEFTQGLADALKTFFILHVHAAHVGGNADVIGDKNEQGIRIRIFYVLLDDIKVFFVAAAAIERLHAANEEHLEWRHQGGSAGAVKNFSQIGFGEIEFVKAEFAQLLRDQVL